MAIEQTQESTEHVEQPSLVDLMSGKKAGPPDLAAEVEKTEEQKQADAAIEAAAAAASLTPEEQAAQDAASTAATKKKAEEDATKTPEELAADKAEEERLAAEAENTETYNITQEEFYTALDGMYGEDINSTIDYGDTNPMSPEGVYIREQAIRDKGIEEFADSLKQSDPRAYSYFLHRSSGGSDDEFFSDRSFSLPDLQALDEDVDLQRSFYERVLLNRGNSPKQAEALIKMAIDNGELLVESQEAYKIFKANELKQAQEIEKVNAAAQERKSSDLKGIGDAINNVLATNSALKLIIPKNEKEQFSTQFRESVHYENGNFFIVKPINKENLDQVMGAELFSFLKGDVSKMINKQATTVAAERTLTRLRKTTQTPSATSAPAAGKALREILTSN